jgi:hypothetical protein
MTKWEYRTISINYDRKQHKNWVRERGGKEPLVGLQVILEAYGSEGWELVSLDGEHYDVSSGVGTWHMDPVVYRATFKRPGEGSL